MKKIVSLLVALCFWVTNVSFAIDSGLGNIPTGGTNLQVPFLLNNILDKSEIAKEPVNIRLWFMACLRTMASEGFDFKKATPVEILDQLKEFGDEQNGEIFHPTETQFFIHEASVDGDRVRVMVRVNKDNSLRTYDVNFANPESVNVSLKRDSKECLPAEGILENMGSLVEFLGGIVELDVEKEKVTLVEGKEDDFIEKLPVLVYNISVNSNDSVKDAIEWIILELGPQLPVNTAVPVSGQVLYRAIGKDYYKKAAILKINQRALIPYLYRIMLKVMRAQNAVAMSQIAISEATYIVADDAQKSPAVNLAQAILAGVGSEGFTPVFNSRDHLQVDRKAYDKDPVAALRSRADTIRDDVLNGKIYSTDLDTSTLALTPEENGDVREQQRPNFESAVKLTIFARLLEAIYNVPSIALNGEVGEVGTEVVTPEELRAYLTGYRDTLDKFIGQQAGDMLQWIKDNNGIFGFTDKEMDKIEYAIDNEMLPFHGLEAMSAQVGTKHGGVKVESKPWKRTGKPVVNMERLEELADICREFGLAGLILHGASSISEEELAEAVKRGAIAVHLATYIHDRIFSHPEFPTVLVSKLFTLLREKNPELLAEQIDKYTPADVKIGDIVDEIDETIKAGKPLSEEQREQVAWIVHTARGKGTSKEEHDRGEGVWSFIDLEKDMMALPKETLAQLNKVVEEQILRYVELLNAKDTGDVIKGVDFPTPPSAPMPGALKGHIISPPEPETSKEVREIKGMEVNASKAGLEMPTHLKTRYTFLLCEGFFKDNAEFTKYQKDDRFKDRFEIDRVSGSTSDQLIGNILAKTQNPHRTVALVPNYLTAEQLKTLTDKGIRFVRTNTAVLLGARNSDDPNREQFQLDTYATMFAVRRMDGSISKDSSVYRTLSFYIRSHFELDDIEAEEYIQAVVDGTVDTLIKGYLAYRPAEPYDVPTYGTIAAALISA